MMRLKHICSRMNFEPQSPHFKGKIIPEMSLMFCLRLALNFKDKTAVQMSSVGFRKRMKNIS